MNKKYIVDLEEEERQRLRRIIRSGKHAARKIQWSHALLKADAGWSDQKIADALSISLPTVQRIRQRFVEEGMDVALGARSHQPRPFNQRLDGKQEAHLIALACSQAPAGRQRWTLRLLADRMVELGYVETVSYETVRRTLKKTR